MDKQKRRSLALGVGLFLFAVYLFVYRGGFHSIDEVSMFAVTESLAKFGQLNTNQIAWTQWTTSQAEAQGFFGVDGQVYSKKGLALSLAQAPLYWLALILPGLGMLQTVSLLNAAITAATDLLIFMFLERLGFSLRTAILTALVFGLATIAFVYAKYLFSEPLAGFLLLLAAYMLFAYRQEGGRRHLLLAGLAAGFAVLTRANNLFLLPVFGLYLLVIAGRPGGSRDLSIPPEQNLTGRDLPIPSERDGEESFSLTSMGRWLAGHPLLMFGLGLAAPGLILLGYNALRSGNPFQTGYDLTLFSPNILLGLYKLLFSPLRGLFVYSPILLLSLPGWWYLHRRQPAEAWLFAGLVGVTVGLFSAWSSGEGLSWGSRFLVPVTPFFALSLAPLVERLAVASTPYALRLGFYLLLLLSFIIQLLGVAINPWIYLAELQADFGGEFFLENTAALYDFRYSQIVGQLQAWSVEYSDLAWRQPWGFDGLAFGLSLLLVLFSGWLLWRLGQSESQPWMGRMTVIAVLASFAISYILLARYYQTDRQFGPPDDAYTEVLEHISAQAAPGAPIITVAQYHYHVPMNRFRARTPLIGFAQQRWPLPETAEPLLATAANQQDIWLVTIGFSTAAPDNAVEQWLALNRFKVGEAWFPDDVRLVRFSSGERMTRRPLEAEFTNGLTLTEVQVGQPAQAGRPLPVEFTWQAATPPAIDYTLFLQLLDSQGALVAQHDSPPAGGYSPTSRWPGHQAVASRHALILPPDLSPGDYRLIAGLYDSASGRRLLLDDGADFVEVGQVTLDQPAGSQGGPVLP